MANNWISYAKKISSRDLKFILLTLRNHGTVFIVASFHTILMANDLSDYVNEQFLEKFSLLLLNGWQNCYEIFTIVSEQSRTLPLWSIFCLYITSQI